MAETYAITGTVAPGASVTKGLIAITAGSVQPFRIISLDVSMDGGSNFWPKFQVVRGTGTFTAPTGGTSLTINQGNGEGQNRFAAATAKVGTFSAELAAGTGSLATTKNWYVPNSSGFFYQFPLGREDYFQASNIFYLQVVTPASFASNIAVNVEFEE